LAAQSVKIKLKLKSPQNGLFNKCGEGGIFSSSPAGDSLSRAELNAPVVASSYARLFASAHISLLPVRIPYFYIIQNKPHIKNVGFIL
jgi:hypothetical protein